METCGKLCSSYFLIKLIQYHCKNQHDETRKKYRPEVKISEIRFIEILVSSLGNVALRFYLVVIGEPVNFVYECFELYSRIDLQNELHHLEIF